MKPYLTLLRVHAAMLLALASIVACNKYEMPEPDNRTPFEIAEARERFEQQLSQRTRSAATEQSGLSMGEIEVDWDAAVTSVGENLYSIDAPIRTDYAYTVAYDSTVMRTHTQLVSVKDKSSGAVQSYIRITVPDPEYARTHTMGDMQRLINTGKQGDFSGLIIYTSMEGVPLYAIKSVNGVTVESISPFDEGYTIYETYDAMRYLLSRYKFFKSDNIQTRNMIDGGEIDDVIIIAYNPERYTHVYIDDTMTPFQLFNTIRSREFGDYAGGGGFSGGPGVDLPRGGGLGFVLPPIMTKWKNVKINGDTEEQNKMIVDTLERLNEIEIFQKIIEDLAQKNITVQIVFDSNCSYLARVAENGDIEYQRPLEAGVLLEEFIHKYQIANNNMKGIDREFEAKSMLARLDRDEILEAPSVTDETQRNKNFWEAFRDFIDHPNDYQIFNTAECYLLEVYSEKFHGQVVTQGRELPNYKLLFR